jgi:hypothetical protein
MNHGCFCIGNEVEIAMIRMEMGIDQSGREISSLGVDDSRLIPPGVVHISNSSNSVSVDGDIGGIYLLGVDVNKPAPFYDHVGRLSPHGDVD